ncbi:MAG TPA: hypothetical protein VKZ55_09025 [Microthrixaceae bacterium]|nr:hypothetical protein [Microthrixaceae bacterium]
MADRRDLRPGTTSLALRILLYAAVVFVVLGVVGWLVGAVISLVRTLVVIAAVLAVAWLVVSGLRR